MVYRTVTVRERQRDLLQPGTWLWLVLLLLLSLPGCRNKITAPAPPPKYAVVRFENLSGNPALDWMGRAASESLPAMLSSALDGPVLASSALGVTAPTLGPHPDSAPGISTERAEALIAGANRIVSGYIDSAGAEIRLTVTEEDIATHKSLRTVTGKGSSPMDALRQLAHNLSPRAGPPPTSNPEAFEDWARALEAPSADGIPLLEKATQLDPNFGPAWVALVSVRLAKGDRAAAQEDLGRAKQHPIDPLSRGKLDLAAAELGGDKLARLAAMRKVAELSPGDMALQRALAESDINAGQFAEGAADWKKIAAASPNDPLVWNSLGYARAYAGDYAGAISALREYERLRPKDANPSDSIGDVNYMNGKFTEAAADYLEAHKRQPGFEQFADLYKASWAKFRAGDKAGADSLFTQFRTERLKAVPADPVVALLEADWQYRTGRQKEAFATLRTLVSETKSERALSDGYAQLTIFDLLQNDRAQAARDAAAMGPKISDRSAFIARFAAQPSASASEWQARADRIPPSAQLRDAALGYALLLDGRRDAAIPVWQHIVEYAPATDFFARAVYARLQGKKSDRPLLPDPLNLNQFAGVLDTL
jgi:Flp pilus assembly protein TadD